ncbi:20130_t:CDS:2, partial [Racocetra fulgida]
TSSSEFPYHSSNHQDIDYIKEFMKKVYIYNNTSIVQDEVLAHRLGLIPIKADPDKFYFKHVLSESLIWVPKGDQEEKYASCPLRPVHNDILIAQMRPGQ